ncbi:MAG: hypothetical protein ACLTKI_06510 [Lachnospiraceae bacterium]
MMISILLTILKILGILLLIILGLAVVLLLTLLFVPIRYGIRGTFSDGNWTGQLKVTWLLHVISYTLSKEKEEESTAKLRIFGIPLSRKKSNDVSKDFEDFPEDPEARVQVQALDSGPGTVYEDPKEQRPLGEKTAEQKTTGQKPRRKVSKLQKIWKKIKFRFRRFCDKLKHGKQLLEQVRDAVKDEANQKTVKLIFVQAKRLIRHIFPKKGKGRIVFGLGDPYLTGQILTYASILYPLYAKRLELCPMFDREPGRKGTGERTDPFMDPGIRRVDAVERS